MPLLVDTTVLIDILRGRAHVARQWEAARRRTRLFICAVSVEELVRGLRPDEEREAERVLRGFRMAPLGRTEGERAGAWRRSYAERGVTLWQGDCLIAAAAYRVGGRLATANVSDFPMPELTVERWDSG